MCEGNLSTGRKPRRHSTNIGPQLTDRFEPRTSLLWGNNTNHCKDLNTCYNAKNMQTLPLTIRWTLISRLFWEGFLLDLATWPMHAIRRHWPLSCWNRFGSLSSSERRSLCGNSYGKTFIWVFVYPLPFWTYSVLSTFLFFESLGFQQLLLL